ncbi:MAG TPA: hypothetical protein VFR42_05625, partial [Candidatus Acidoferrum sp.]|nr:hypothetical protein [Candidatus Acidoferrum sp.]
LPPCEDRKMGQRSSHTSILGFVAWMRTSFPQVFSCRHLFPRTVRPSVLNCVLSAIRFCIGKPALSSRLALALFFKNRDAYPSPTAISVTMR